MQQQPTPLSTDREEAGSIWQPQQQQHRGRGCVAVLSFFVFTLSQPSDFITTVPPVPASTRAGPRRAGTPTELEIPHEKAGEPVKTAFEAGLSRGWSLIRKPRQRKKIRIYQRVPYIQV